jgi:hypothetical protein
MPAREAPERRGTARLRPICGEVRPAERRVNNVTPSKTDQKESIDGIEGKLVEETGRERGG